MNPEKCVFGVPSGKLLGFLVSHQGIEANPNKIQAIEHIQAPKRVKEVQHLNGCTTALGRFISRLGEHALPFFKLLQKSGPINWTPKAEATLQDLKRYLASLPILVALKAGERLLLYVAAMTQVVSAVLVAEREEDPGTEENPDKAINSEQPNKEPQVIPAKKHLVQHPVYFISMALRDAQVRYPNIQKLLLGVLIASRKLRHYFEAHPITMVMSHLHERVLHKHDAMGRIAEWALKLSGFNLHFTNTTTIKSRVLADFVAE